MALGRRTFLASTVASLAAPAFVRLARADAPHFTLTLQHALSSVSCVHANFLAPWAHKIETQSNGRIHIDIFPSMQLGGQPADLFDQARDRIADIVLAMPSKTPGRFPTVELFELPFVPPRRALVGSRAIEDFSAKFLQDEFRDVHPLCFSCADRGILHAHRPIETLAQVTGLRLDVRTRLAGEAVQALGASAVPVPNGQLPLAITRHVVDGCVIPWDMVPALRLHELLDSHTDFADDSLSTTTYVLAMNKTAYEKLPAELKKVIDDNSGQVAAGMAGAMWDLQAKAVADMVSQAGQSIITLAPDAVSHWRKATDPVIDGWMKQAKARKINGEKLLASARSLFTKYANEPEPQPPAPPPQQTAEAKTGINPPAKTGAAARAPAANSVPAPAVKTSVATAAPNTAPSTAPAKPPWWQFWKSASPPAPATASAAPATPSPVPAAPPPAPPAAAVIVKSAPVAPPPAPTTALDIPM